jgi:hypothetical protein
MSCNQLLKQVDQLGEECSQPNWNGYTSDPINKETICNVKNVIRSIDLSYPLPTLGVEPDGYITLEWYKNTHNLLSLSIGSDIYMYYAGLKFNSTFKGKTLLGKTFDLSLYQYIKLIFN